MTEQKSRFVKASEICEDLGICRQTLRRWIEAGTFPPPLRLHRNFVWMRQTYEDRVAKAIEETTG